MSWDEKKSTDAYWKLEYNYMTKEEWDKYKDLEFYPDKVCICGCGSRLRVKPYHRWWGIPNSIVGHHRKGCSCFYCRVKRGEFRGENNPSKRPEVAAKISKSNKGRKQSKEERKKRSRILQGHIVTEETREKIRQANTGKKTSFISKEKMKNSNKTVLLWKDFKYVKMMVKAQHRKPNKVEKRLDKLLQEIVPGEYQINVKAEVMILAGKCPDFVNINGQKKIIEMYGDWWHREEKTGRTKEEEEQQRINLFAKEGYQTLVIWEHELKNIDMLEKKILEFNNE